MLYDDTSQFATVVMAYLSAGPEGGIDLRVALAGHPAPAIVRRDGRVEMVGRYGTMAGLHADIEVHDAAVRLDADELLLLYTDGVTEAGPRDAPFGEAGLVAVLKGLAGHSPQEVVDTVEQAVVAAQPGDPRDDIALLAISPTGVVDEPARG
jgi:serine phosphatase RsbU (regulator of sigma subunit)